MPYRNKADKAAQMRRYRAKLRMRKGAGTISQVSVPITQSPMRRPITQDSVRSSPATQGFVRSVPATKAPVRGVPATQFPVRSVPLPERRPMASPVTRMQPERRPVAKPSQPVPESRPANRPLTAARRPNASAVGISIATSRDHRVRRISEIPQEALDRAGIQRSGGLLSAGPGVDIPKFMKMWLKMD
jgi:hypothetical protein